MERPDLVAIARAAFGEHADRTPGAQARQHLVQHAAHRFAAAALVVDRFAARGEPADQRPAADLALGDEAHHALAVQRDDVDPADVVGDEQRRARQRHAAAVACGSRRCASVRPATSGSCDGRAARRARRCGPIGGASAAASAAGPRARATASRGMRSAKRRACGAVHCAAPAGSAITASVRRETHTSLPRSSSMRISHTCVWRPTCSGRAVPVTRPSRTPRTWLALISMPTQPSPSPHAQHAGGTADGFGQQHRGAAVQQAIGLVGARVDRHGRAQEVGTDFGEDDAERLHRGADRHRVERVRWSPGRNTGRRDGRRSAMRAAAISRT